MIEHIIRMTSKGLTPQEIADLLDEDIELVVRIRNILEQNPDITAAKIFEQL